MGAAGISVIALAIVLIFFITQRRQGNAAWQRYRERQRRRRHRPATDEPPDPNFQFDRPE